MELQLVHVHLFIYLFIYLLLLAWLRGRELLYRTYLQDMMITILYTYNKCDKMILHLWHTHTHTQHWTETREKESKSISEQWSVGRCGQAGHRPRDWLLQGKWACRTSGQNKQCLPTPGSPLRAAIFGARPRSNSQCPCLSRPTDWRQGRGYSSAHNWE